MTRLNVENMRGEILRNIFKACSSLYFVDARDGSGLKRANLWAHQAQMFATMLRQRAEGNPARLLCLKTRRAGTSTASAIWTFHHFYWKPHQHALTVAQHDQTTSVIYEMYQAIYHELPQELKIPLQKLNRKELRCEAPWASNLIAQTAGYLDIGRGLTIQHAHLSEIDYWPEPSVALDGILNTVHWHPDTSIIIESTANGSEGWLHHFWNETVAGRTAFAPLFQAWYDVPEHRIPLPDDFEATDEEEEWMGQYTLEKEQVYWYRRKMQETVAKEPWGGERTMRQEFPFTPEQAFQSSGLCIFPDMVLQRLREGIDKPPEQVVRLVPTGVAQFKAERCDRGYDGALEIYHKPEPQRQYSLGVDVSDGVGLTESVVSVFAYPGYEQVAEWASNQSSVEHTAWVARYMAGLFGGANCMIIPETNKSGILVLYILNQLPGDYSIFRWRYLDKPGVRQTDTPTLGWTTNEGTKKILAQVANLLFMAGTGEVRSPILYDQMTRCVDILPGRRWRVQGKGTDRVLAGLISIVGCYLEFEGGSMGGVTSMNSDPQREKQPSEHKGYFDSDWERDFSGLYVPSRSGPYARDDWEI